MDFFGPSNPMEGADGTPVYLREEDLPFQQDRHIHGVGTSAECYGLYRR